jgi:hypothetical protein
MLPSVSVIPPTGMLRVALFAALRTLVFLQFKHDGRVRTAAFTREVGREHGH